MIQRQNSVRTKSEGSRALAVVYSLLSQIHKLYPQEWCMLLKFAKFFREFNLPSHKNLSSPTEISRTSHTPPSIIWIPASFNKWQMVSANPIIYKAPPTQLARQKISPIDPPNSAPSVREILIVIISTSVHKIHGIFGKMRAEIQSDEPALIGRCREFVHPFLSHLKGRPGSRAQWSYRSSLRMPLLVRPLRRPIYSRCIFYFA